MTLPPDSPSWWEHVDLMQVLLGVLLIYVVWTFKRALQKFDESQTNASKTFVDLYERLNALDKRVVHVETTHEVKGCAAPQGGKK